MEGYTRQFQPSSLALAPGEEVVLQQHPSPRSGIAVGVILIVLGVALAGLMLIIEDGPPPGYAVLALLVLGGGGYLVMDQWKRRSRRMRLTVTNRRVIMENLALPEKTVEIRYSPTFSVTVVEVNYAAAGLIVQGEGKKMNLAYMGRIRELADLIATMREQALAESVVDGDVAGGAAGTMEATIEPALAEDTARINPDEQVLGRYRSHARANLAALIGGILLIIPVLIFAFVATELEDSAQALAYVVAGAIALCTPLCFYAHWHYNRHTQLTVTDRRIIFRGGWLSLKEIELPVSSDLQVDWPRNVKHPVIKIISPAGRIDMRGVLQPDSLIGLIQRLTKRATAEQ